MSFNNYQYENIIKIINSDEQNNDKKLEEFFLILKQFENSTYDERINLMKRTWNQTILDQIPTTVYYGNSCKIKIYMKDNKYKFDFLCDTMPVEKYEQYHPKLLEPFKEILDNWPF